MKDQNNKNGSVNSIAAVVTGALVGAGVVAAGALALKDKKTRVKVNDVLASTEKKLTETKGEVSKVADSAKEAKKEVKKIWQK